MKVRPVFARPGTVGRGRSGAPSPGDGRERIIAPGGCAGSIRVSSTPGPCPWSPLGEVDRWACGGAIPRLVEAVDEFWQCFGTFTDGRTLEEYDAITTVAAEALHLIFSASLGLTPSHGERFSS